MLYCKLTTECIIERTLKITPSSQLMKLYHDKNLVVNSCLLNHPVKYNAIIHNHNTVFSA